MELFKCAYITLYRFNSVCIFTILNLYFVKINIAVKYVYLLL